MRQYGRSMTIHRERQPAGATVADAGAALTIVQVCICIVVLVAVFTMQFIDENHFKQTGELYQAVMGNSSEGDGAAIFVGAFGTPISKELLEECIENIAKIGMGQGGETPYCPKNLYMGDIAIMADTAYPAYGVVTSKFGVRSHPISGKPDFHTGLDIAAPMGADIYAVLPGIVAETGRSDIYGNYIRLEHGNGLETVYNHCSAILATEGAVMRRGERLALVGSTGISTGSHLHMDLLINGNYADPLQIFRLNGSGND